MKFTNFHVFDDFIIFCVFVNFIIFCKNMKNRRNWRFWSKLTIFTILKIDEKSEKNVFFLRCAPNVSGWLFFSWDFWSTWKLQKVKKTPIFSKTRISMLYFIEIWRFSKFKKFHQKNGSIFRLRRLEHPKKLFFLLQTSQEALRLLEHFF